MMQDIMTMSTLGSTITEGRVIGPSPLSTCLEDNQWDTKKVLRIAGNSLTSPAFWQDDYTTLTNVDCRLAWKRQKKIDSSIDRSQNMLMPNCSRRILGFFSRQKTNLSALALPTCSMLARVVATLLVLVFDSAHFLLDAFSYLMDQSQNVWNANPRCYRFCKKPFVVEVFQSSREKSRNLKHLIKKSNFPRHSVDWMVLIIPVLLVRQCTLACNDMRLQLSNYDCLDYDATTSTFEMTCSFTITDTTRCIVLHKNETFEGNGHSINLDGVYNWEGLFQIDTDIINGPSSLQDAPVIHDVHMIGGETSTQGGFIIQAEQRHFIVRNCSSSGVIKGGCPSACLGGGGICGHGCSGDILITHCWSTGEIRYAAGGIAGKELGLDGDKDNTVTISNCYSTGDLSGQNSGGICGHRASFYSKGMIIIKQCYSLGKIDGARSGGITGGDTAQNDGHVTIINCYSRGDITGSGNAGGICGRNAGFFGGTVILTNVYASGKIDNEDAAGLIGSIAGDADEINITMSVYNGDTGDMIGWHNDAHNKERNSGDLTNINGTVYCHNGGDENAHKECWDTETIWQPVDGDFPIFIGKADVAATPAGTPSSSMSPSPKETSTPTSTSTGTNTGTITPSHTAPSTPTVTRTPSQTSSLTPSFTASETGTVASSISPTLSPTSAKTATSSHSGTLSSTGTPSPSPTKTISRTGTATPSTTRSKTPNETPSPSVTPTNRKKREQMKLPVQYPRRSVIINRDTKERKTRKMI